MEGAAAVYHLAALGSVPYSYTAPRSFVDTNVIGTLHVLEAVRACRTPRLVHTSTSETYGTARTVPISEAHLLQAQSPYAASKIAADKLAESYYLSFGTPVVTLRPFNTFGPRQSARAVIPAIIIQLAAGSRQLKLGALDPTRDFSYVTDTAQAFVDLGEAPASAVLGEVFNVGPGDDVSIGQLAEDIAGLMGVEADIVEDPQRLRPKDSEVMRLVCDASKLRDRTGWQPRYTRERACARPSTGSSSPGTWPATTPTSTASELYGGIMHAVILAGGKGIRLRPYTTRLPKPLVPIGDEHSILEIVLSQLARSRLQPGDAGHRPLRRTDPVLHRRRQPVGPQVDYTERGVPLGTMGPVLQILDRLPEQFLIMNGDVLTDLDYADLMRRHAASARRSPWRRTSARCSIDYGVLTTRDGHVVDFTEKPTIDYRVSMGVYACTGTPWPGTRPGCPFGFDELVLDMLARGTPPQEYAFTGYWFDIGRPEDYDRVNAEFGAAPGKPAREA